MLRSLLTVLFGAFLLFGAFAAFAPKHVIDKVSGKLPDNVRNEIFLARRKKARAVSQFKHPEFKTTDLALALAADIALDNGITSLANNTFGLAGNANKGLTGVTHTADDIAKVTAKAGSNAGNKAASAAVSKGISKGASETVGLTASKASAEATKKALESGASAAAAKAAGKAASEAAQKAVIAASHKAGVEAAQRAAASGASKAAQKAAQKAAEQAAAVAAQKAALVAAKKAGIAATQRAAAQAASKGILMSNPVGWALAFGMAVSIAADSLDAYGYNRVVTRSELDYIISSVRSSLYDIMNDNCIGGAIMSIESLFPGGVTPDGRLVKDVYANNDTVIKFCHDKVTAVPTGDLFFEMDGLTWSGFNDQTVPQEGTNDLYYDSFIQYYNQNKDKYSKNAYTTSQIQSTTTSKNGNGKRPWIKWVILGVIFSMSLVFVMDMLSSGSGSGSGSGKRVNPSQIQNRLLPNRATRRP